MSQQVSLARLAAAPAIRASQRPPPRSANGQGRGEIVCLIPAHNEEDTIGAVLSALLRQDRVPDRIVVICDNCADDTEAVARRFPVTVIRTERNTHRKAGALNLGWRQYCRTAFMIVAVDADTVLPANAVADWLAGLQADPGLGGLSSKFTMLGAGYLTRLQRMEFARWSEASLRRGHTSVLAGTGCAIRGDALSEVARVEDSLRDGRGQPEGPWSYDSAVEDFCLTYRIRQLGYRCRVAENVPAYTDSMKTIRSLWAQRMKWQVGTVRDLLRFGFNRLTARDWAQQVLGLFAAAVRIFWLCLWVVGGITGWLRPSWVWWAFPILFAAADLAASLRIPREARDWKDLGMSALLLPNEMFAWMRAAWFLAGWHKALFSRVADADLWADQYRTDGTATRLS